MRTEPPKAARLLHLVGPRKLLNPWGHQVFAQDIFAVRVLLSAIDSNLDCTPVEADSCKPLPIIGSPNTPTSLFFKSSKYLLWIARCSSLSKVNPGTVGPQCV